MQISLYMKFMQVKSQMRDVSQIYELILTVPNRFQGAGGRQAKGKLILHRACVGPAVNTPAV